MSANANNRASLLAGLRTGGVRSSSGPTMVPHTAAPGGAFNVPRFPSQQYAMDDDIEDELADLVHQNLHLNGGHRGMMQYPATAGAGDGGMNKFQQQQQQALLRQMAAQRAAMNGMGAMQGMNGMSVDPLQMQVVQMEIMKLQALQQAQQMQQYQVELFHQAQIQQAQQQAQSRPARRLSGFPEPATAGPTATSFDLHANGHDENQMPMTAAIGGRFANRPPPLPLGNGGLNPHANVFQMRNGDVFDEPPKTPKTPTRTTVISGGTALGTGMPTAAAPTVAVHTNVATVTSNIAPSKSDSAISWRRGGAPVNGAPRAVSGQPAVLVTPPDESIEKMRPQPLRFTNGSGVPTIAIDDGGSDGEGSSGSQPSTPPSAGSFDARAEAAKKLYEGLGIGRPAPVPAPVHMLVKNTQVIRQPRGPPGATEELMARNFATRFRGGVVAVEA